MSALMRIAVAVPRSEWLRDPAEPWALLQGAEEGATVEDPDPLLALEALLRHVFCKFDDAPLPAAAAGFTWNDGCGVGYSERRGGPSIVMCSLQGLNIALRFARLYAAVGRGESPVAAAKEYLTPALTKKMVKNLSLGSGPSVPPPPVVEVPDTIHHSQPESVRLASPVAMLRSAQVAALGGPERVAQAATLGSRLGKEIGSPEEEEFALSVLEWACRFADVPELAEPKAVGQAIEWLLAQRASDPKFEVTLNGNPRSPEKVPPSADYPPK